MKIKSLKKSTIINDIIKPKTMKEYRLSYFLSVSGFNNLNLLPIWSDTNNVELHKQYVVKNIIREVDNRVAVYTFPDIKYYVNKYINGFIEFDDVPFLKELDIKPVFYDMTKAQLIDKFNYIFKSDYFTMAQFDNQDGLYIPTSLDEQSINTQLNRKSFNKSSFYSDFVKYSQNVDSIIKKLNNKGVVVGNEFILKHSAELSYFDIIFSRAIGECAGLSSNLDDSVIKEFSLHSYWELSMDKVEFKNQNRPINRVMKCVDFNITSKNIDGELRDVKIFDFVDATLSTSHFDFSNQKLYRNSKLNDKSLAFYNIDDLNFKIGCYYNIPLIFDDLKDIYVIDIDAVDSTPISKVDSDMIIRNIISTFASDVSTLSSYAIISDGDFDFNTMLSDFYKNKKISV